MKNTSVAVVLHFERLRAKLKCTRNWKQITIESPIDSHIISLLRPSWPPRRWCCKAFAPDDAQPLLQRNFQCCRPIMFLVPQIDSTCLPCLAMCVCHLLQVCVSWAHVVAFIVWRRIRIVPCSRRSILNNGNCSNMGSRNSKQQQLRRRGMPLRALR